MTIRRGVCDAVDCHGLTSWPCLDDACRIADAMTAPPDTEPRRRDYGPRGCAEPSIVVAAALVAVVALFRRRSR